MPKLATRFNSLIVGDGWVTEIRITKSVYVPYEHHPEQSYHHHTHYEYDATDGKTYTGRFCGGDPVIEYMPIHISQVKDKSASNLANLNLADDWYHNNIADAAKQKVKEGDGHAVYGGQYSSGSVWWQN